MFGNLNILTKMMSTISFGESYENKSEKNLIIPKTYYESVHNIIMEAIPKIPEDITKLINEYAEEKRVFTIYRNNYVIHWSLPDECRHIDIPHTSHMFMVSDIYKDITPSYAMHINEILKNTDKGVMLAPLTTIDTIDIQCKFHNCQSICDMCSKSKQCYTLFSGYTTIFVFCHDYISDAEYFWKQGLTLSERLDQRDATRVRRMTCHTGKRRSRKKSRSRSGDRSYMSQYQRHIYESKHGSIKKRSGKKLRKHSKKKSNKRDRRRGSPGKYSRY